MSGLTGKLTAFCALGAMLVAAPHAVAAKTWSGAKTLTDPGMTVDAPRVAVNGRGHAVVAWVVLDQNGDTSSIQAATRGRRGGFGPAVTLGPASDPGPNLPPTLSAVAVDQRGDMIVAWVARDGAGNALVQTSFRPQGGEFGEPETLSAPGEPATEPGVAFDKRGRAIAVWSRLEGTAAVVQTAFRPRGGEFGEPQTVSPEGYGSIFPSVGMSDSGDAVLAWLAQEVQPPFTQYTQAIAKPKGGAFGPVQTLSDPRADADDPRLAVSRDGEAMVAWRQVPPGMETGEIATAFAPRGGQFEQGVAIPAESGMDAFQPRVALDRRARATLLWRETPPLATAGTNIVRSAVANPGEAFGTAQTLDTTQDQLLDPSLAVARAGNAVSAWSEIPSNPPNPLWTAKRGRRQAEFGAAETLNPAGVSAGSPSVASNRRVGIAVWEVSTGDDGTAVLANVLRRR